MVSLAQFAHTGYFAVKKRVGRFDRWPVWQQIRRGVQAPVYRFADTGLFGLTPLQTHILICGFPAAGTTLLQLMIENGLPLAKRFGKERSGWKAATYSLRNHSVLISKQPRDLLRLEPLRAFYTGRNAKLRIILMLRDPRDLMTVQRERDEKLAYCGCMQAWRNDYRAYLQQRDRDDTLVVRFEDLLASPAAEQRRIEMFTNCTMGIPFEQFEQVKRNDFDTSTLRGLRPIDPTRVARWKDPVHRERIQQVLMEMPELPGALVRLGYETDTAWVQEYA
jgi:hypothetical protein